MTPNSNPSSYLSVSDFLLRRDGRSVAQYVSDDPSNPVQVSDLPTNPALLIILQAASGMLESATLQSGRYAPLDLLTLNGNSLEYMKQILSNLTMYMVMTRRPGPAPPDTITDAYNDAILSLKNLSEGVQIFAFIETEASGVAANQTLTGLQILQKNMITSRWQRYFGIRQNLVGMRGF